MIEVPQSLVLLLVGFAFLAGLFFGWGVFEMRQVSRLVNDDRRRRKAERRDADDFMEDAKDSAASLDAAIAVLPKPSVVNKTKALAVRPRWNRGDEDELLRIGIDATRLATDEDRQL